MSVLYCFFSFSFASGISAVLISRTKMAEQQRHLTSNRQIENLKLKIMTLRKENEALKRKLSGSHSQER